VTLLILKLEGYMIFKFNQIEWAWQDDCQEKQYWDTWIPKKSDLKIVTKLSREDKQDCLNELWENLQPDIQFTRDRNNARRKQKRLDKKS
jgi:beta-glucosidase/6-phospho-beta-glucosidase/beta-galactosidase